MEVPNPVLARAHDRGACLLTVMFVNCAQSVKHGLALCRRHPPCTNSHTKHTHNAQVTQHTQTNTQRLALGVHREEIAEELASNDHDGTLPDLDNQRTHGALVEAFVAAVYGEGGPGEAGKTAGSKRKAEVSSCVLCVCVFDVRLGHTAPR